MTRAGAWIGTVVFLVVAPGVLGGLVPWWLTGWQRGDTNPALVAVGWLLVVAGTAALLSAFARFAGDGRGTPAPVAPPQTLVVTGLYRFVRNPMYLAVTSVIVGQGLLLARPVLYAYAAAFLASVFAFVKVYEEPTLTAEFGDSYDAYRAAVPGWYPRLTPWRPSGHPRHID